MKKLISLIKVSLNHDMNIFKINSKKQSKASKILFPLVLTAYLMLIMGTYSEMLIEALAPMHLEFIVLSVFGLIVSFISLLEGIYKSSSLLFNCKDDNMLLSLPLRKSTILFIRIFKFYVFELLYNSLFLLPAMVIYAYHVNPSWTFYLSSLIALLILPVIPIVLSCIIGFIITYLSSKVKGKNIFQSIISIIFVLAIMVMSFKMQSFAEGIVEKAASINDIIVKLYYPVGAYISLVNNFDIGTLLIYIFSHIIIFAIITLILGKIYFKINSSFKKETKVHHKNVNYVNKKRSRASAFVHKELNKFLTTPVFITNAGIGLVIFILICIITSLKFDSVVASMIKDNPEASIDMIKSYLPLALFGLVAFSSFMTSITSSMISLEGKSFRLLKSFPISSTKIVMYKVLTALIIMVPCLILGDLIVFIRFGFNIIDMILIVLASIILPLTTQLIGIIINLKYPKVDATNDTEVVKQSMSSAISVFIGMGLLAITGGGMLTLFGFKTPNYIIMLIVIVIYSLISILLRIYLSKNCEKYFNEIVA